MESSKVFISPSDRHTRLEDIDRLIEGAGEATTQPPAPLNGIPKQTIPSWIRWCIRACFLPFILIDLSMQKLAKKLVKPPYVQKGGCKKRGNCCFYVLIDQPKTFLQRLHLWWNLEINGFYLRDFPPVEVDGKMRVVMGCRFLNKNGSCSDYYLRPAICRKWPIIEHFGEPRILKGCGYYSEPRDKKHPLHVINQ